MGHFSFLALDTHQKSKSTGAKPACHGTYEAVSDEYTTSGTITSHIFADQVTIRRHVSVYIGYH